MISTFNKGNEITLPLMGGQQADVGDTIRYMNARVEVKTLFKQGRQEFIKGIVLNSFKATTNVNLWSWEVEPPRLILKKGNKWELHGMQIKDQSTTENYRLASDTEKPDLITKVTVSQEEIKKVSTVVITGFDAYDRTITFDSMLPETAMEVTIGGAKLNVFFGGREGAGFMYKFYTDNLSFSPHNSWVNDLKGELIGTKFDVTYEEEDTLELPTVYDVKWVRAGDFELLERYEMV